MSDNLRKVEIGDIFNFPETNSKITKKFCLNHKGSIPVYASSKDKTSTLGYIQDGLKGVKYYENCLSWNRNGSVGYVFLRDHKFSTNEDHRALELKSEYKKELDLLYLQFEIEKQLFINGFSYLDKGGVGKIKEVSIFIPVTSDGKFDLNGQVNLANKYQRLDSVKSELRDDFNSLDAVIVNVNSDSKVSLMPMNDLFEIKKGDSKYTKQYIHKHEGLYPVYSSQTTKLGEIGTIDTYDYDEECFTWTTDGVYAGTVFYRNGKFSVTTHCGVLVVKAQYRSEIDPKYLYFKLNQTFPLNTLGEWANKRLGVERIKELSIEVPIGASGEPDTEEQRRIASKYEKIEDIKRQVRDDYEELIQAKVSVIREDVVAVS
ncbi:MAG: restriction endonuclease subunit S [Candidatus Saccharimonadales bacterium]